MDLFPIIQPELFNAADGGKKKTSRDVRWDENGVSLKNGEPIFVENEQAAAGWARRCLMTKRNAYEIFSCRYGVDLDDLIGMGYDRSSVEAETARMVKEALMENEYITDVSGIETSFEGTLLSITCKITAGGKEIEIAV